MFGFPLFPNPRALAVRSRLVLAGIVLVVASGCGSEQPDFIEVKRLDEKILESELNAFLRIVHRLPERQFPALSGGFAPLPEWGSHRTLPVNELVNEEIQHVDDRWSVDWLVRHAPKNRGLNRALRQEGMTLDQFIGLGLALGLSVSASTIDGQYDLDTLIDKGDQVIEKLRRDNRPYSSLNPETKYHVLQQAGWITRRDRAARLKSVPPENRELVARYAEELADLLPPLFTRDPLAAVADHLEEQGIPFEELPEVGVDDQIEWTPQRALIGYD